MKISKKDALDILITAGTQIPWSITSRLSEYVLGQGPVETDEKASNDTKKEKDLAEKSHPQKNEDEGTTKTTTSYISIPELRLLSSVHARRLPGRVCQTISFQTDLAVPSIVHLSAISPILGLHAIERNANIIDVWNRVFTRTSFELETVPVDWLDAFKDGVRTIVDGAK